jgi:nitroreductase
VGVELYEALRTTRAVRRLRTDPIPDDVLRRVLEAASWAPTGGNTQPWRVIAVRDAEPKRKLAELYLPRWEAYSKFHRKGLAGAPAAVRERQEKLARPSVVGGASIYPAVQNALLACRAEGLGCTLTTLLCAEEPAVKAALGIPAEWYTAAHVPIGWPASKGHGPLRRRAVADLAYLDGWGKPFPA